MLAFNVIVEYLLFYLVLYAELYAVFLSSSA